VQWFDSRSTNSRAWFASGDSDTSLGFIIGTLSDGNGGADVVLRAMPNVRMFQSSAEKNIILSSFTFVVLKNRPKDDMC
jgi:hypothetical protein